VIKRLSLEHCFNISYICRTFGKKINSTLITQPNFDLMKFLKKPLTYLLPLLAFGLIACGGPSAEEIAALEAAIADVTLDTEDVTADDIADDVEPATEVSGDGFTSKDGHFTINFPGEPTHSEQSVATEVGDILMETYMYQKSETEIFMVAYSDYPSIYVSESNAEELLAGGKTGAMESLGIVATETDEDVELNGHPGNYFTANNGQYYVCYEMYLVNNRLYQIAILRDGSSPTQEDVDGFTKTFNLTEIGSATAEAE
jgi:hypothetical protein